MRTFPPLPEITCGFLIQMVFCKKESVTPFLTGAPPPPGGGAPVRSFFLKNPFFIKNFFKKFKFFFLKKSWIRPCLDFNCNEHFQKYTSLHDMVSILYIISTKHILSKDLGPENLA